jgi:hypothetical protein
MSTSIKTNRGGFIPKDTWQDRFIEHFSKNYNIGKACEYAGISRQTYHNYMSSDLNFRERVNDCKEAATDNLEAAAYTRATFGVKKITPIMHQGKKVGQIEETKFSDRLAEFFLKSHRPDLYDRARKIEHSGTVTLEHKVEIGIKVTQMVQKQLSAGYSLEESLANLLSLGVPQEQLELVDGSQLTLLNEGEGYLVTDEDDDSQGEPDEQRLSELPTDQPEDEDEQTYLEEDRLWDTNEYKG